MDSSSTQLSLHGLFYDNKFCEGFQPNPRLSQWWFIYFCSLSCVIHLITRDVFLKAQAFLELHIYEKSIGNYLLLCVNVKNTFQFPFRKHVGNAEKFFVLGTNVINAVKSINRPDQYKSCSLGNSALRIQL